MRVSPPHPPPSVLPTTNTPSPQRLRLATESAGGKGVCVAVASEQELKHNGWRRIKSGSPTRFFNKQMDSQINCVENKVGERSSLSRKHPQLQHLFKNRRCRLADRRRIKELATASFYAAVGVTGRRFRAVRACVCVCQNLLNVMPT